MTAATRARAAYEAYRRAEVSPLRSPAAREMALAGKGWETLSGDEQAWWMIAAHAAVAAQDARPAPGGPLRSDTETAAMLRADLADAEAQLAKWPRCPGGCSCRLGFEGDADRNECGCDGPCNGGTAPGLALREALAGHAAFLSEILGALNTDEEPDTGETPEDFAVRCVRYLEDRITELHSLIAAPEPLSVVPADDARPAPGLAEVRDALERIVTTFSVQAIHVIAADMLVALDGTSARQKPKPAPELAAGELFSSKQERRPYREVNLITDDERDDAPGDEDDPVAIAREDGDYDDCEPTL